MEYFSVGFIQFSRKWKLCIEGYFWSIIIEIFSDTKWGLGYDIIDVFFFFTCIVISIVYATDRILICWFFFSLSVSCYMIFRSCIIYIRNLTLKCLLSEILNYSIFYVSGLSLGAGILFGLITMLIQYVGLFMTGFHTGLLLGLISIAAADVLHYKINSVWTNSSILMGFGVISAFMTLAWKKGRWSIEKVINILWCNCESKFSFISFIYSTMSNYNTQSNVILVSKGGLGVHDYSL